MHHETERVCAHTHTHTHSHTTNIYNTPEVSPSPMENKKQKVITDYSIQSDVCIMWSLQLGAGRLTLHTEVNRHIKVVEYMCHGCQKEMHSAVVLPLCHDLPISALLIYWAWTRQQVNLHLLHSFTVSVPAPFITLPLQASSVELL